MLRQELLKKYINKEKIGLEIGPLFWGICRKDEGFNVLIWDVMQKEELLDKYKKESKTSKKGIEEIDIVSSESMKITLTEYTKKKGAIIKSVPESLDYIISSHNVEHMPNPVQFFIDTSQILKEGGVLNIAIPISTRCFDCSKPLTSTGQILDAYISKNKKPSLGEFFDHEFSMMNVINEKNKRMPINDMNFDFEKLIFERELTYDSYKDLVDAYNKSPYKDSHVWQFNLDSFLLIFEDLLKCKIIENLEIIDSEIIGNEFIISIRKNKTKKQIISSKERRLNLKKESLISYISDLTNKNKNIFFSEEFFEINNTEFLEISNQISHLKNLKNQLLKRFYFFSRKILKNTLSENKYKYVKSIYQKLSKKIFFISRG